MRTHSLLRSSHDSRSTYDLVEAGNDWCNDIIFLEVGRGVAQFTILQIHKKYIIDDSAPDKKWKVLGQNVLPKLNFSEHTYTLGGHSLCRTLPV